VAYPMRYLRPTLLIESNSFFRHGLQHLLSRTRFRCCHVASTVEEIPTKAISSRASLCILGIGADWTPVLKAIHRIRALNATLPVVGLCSHCDDDKLMAAFEAGISGFLTKDVSCEGLINFLELIAQGERIVPAALLKRFMARAPATTPTVPHPMAQAMHPAIRTATDTGDRASGCLSNREEAILLHLMSGVTNKIIARSLGITEATVKVHVKAILRKIRVKNRTQAAIWAMENLRKTAGESRQVGKSGNGASAETIGSGSAGGTGEGFVVASSRTS